MYLELGKEALFGPRTTLEIRFLWQCPGSVRAGVFVCVVCGAGGGNGPGQCLAFVCGPRLPPARARPSAPRHARSRASARSNDLNCVPD